MPCELTTYMPNFLSTQHDQIIISDSQKGDVESKQEDDHRSEEDEADNEYYHYEDQLRAALAASLAQHTGSSSSSKTQREDRGSASKKIKMEVRFSSMPSR